MYKKITILILCIAILLSFSSAVMAEEAGELLKAIFKTDITMQKNFDDLGKLSDGNFANSAVCFLIDKTVDMASENHYVEAGFSGNTVQINRMIIGTYVATMNDQSITKIRFEYHDAENDSWVTELAEQELMWESDNSQLSIEFNSPITTDCVRVYLLDAYRTWNNCRMEELQFFGSVASTPRDRLMGITASVNFPYKNDVTNLFDNNYKSEILISKNPSDTDPCVINLDFGEKLLSVDKLDITSMFVNNAGITKMSVEYFRYGTWINLGEHAYTHDGSLTAVQSNIGTIEVEANICASKMRINIYSANFTWNTFRISEVALFGTDMTDNTDSDIYAQCTADKLETNKLTLTREYAFIPTAVKIKNVGYVNFSITYASGEVLSDIKTVSGNDQLIIIIGDRIMTDKLVIASDSDFSFDTVEMYALDPVSETETLINTFLTSKKFSDYQAALYSVGLINHTKTHGAMMSKIDEAVLLLKNEQNINAKYDVRSKKLSFDGYIFSDATPKTFVLKDGTNSFEYTVSTDENGAFSYEADLSDKTFYGEYELSCGEVKTKFVTRAPYSGTEISDFKIDGVNAVINSDILTLTLPAYADRKNKIAVFSVSDGTILYIGETKLVSGETKFNYSESNEIRAVAENGTEKNYTLKLSIETATSGGSSGGSSSGGSSSSGGGKLGTITLPSSVTALPKEEEKEPIEIAPFMDVSKSHWAYSFINELKNANIINGDNGKFLPEEDVKREEFVKMLVMTVGISQNGSVAFSDTKGTWFEEYVSAAVNNGMINGISEDMFGAGMKLTREDACVILYRSLPADKKTLGEYVEFSDDELISDYARNAVYTLKSLKIIEGNGKDFNPKSGITRAEAAKLLSLRRGL